MAGPSNIEFLDLDAALRRIVTTDAEVIHLSGGEPLAHPDFYTILCAAQAKLARGTCGYRAVRSGGFLIIIT